MACVGFIKLMRSDKTLALMGDPNAFTLAGVIAWRAQRTNAFNIYGLSPGEALLGDHAQYGMSEQQYRSAKKRLTKWGIAAFRATTRGTIAKLCDDTVYDIHPELVNGRVNTRPTDKPRTGHDYQEGKNARRQEHKSDDGLKGFSRLAPGSRSPFGSTIAM